MSFWSEAPYRRSTMSLASLEGGRRFSKSGQLGKNGNPGSPHQLPQPGLIQFRRAEQTEKGVAVDNVAQQGDVQREPHEPPDALELGDEAKHVRVGAHKSKGLAGAELGDDVEGEIRAEE